MLTEFSMEQLGNVIGDGYVALCHSLDNGEVTKSTVDYIGSCDVDEFDPANFVSRDWEKGIDPIFIYFDEFSPDVYYDRAEKIWDNDYKEIVKEEKEASTFTERAKVQAGVFSSIFAGR